MTPETQKTVILGIELLLGVVSLLFLLSLASSGRPFRTAVVGLRPMFSPGPHLPPLLAVVALWTFNMVESQFDSSLTAWLGYDLTDLFHRFEGNAAAWLQQWSYRPLTLLFGFFYVVMFPVQLFACLLASAARRDNRQYRALVSSVAINYALCFPFLLLFPVREHWSANPDAAMLLNSIHPLIMDGYRATSALDNCFPSFHTSLSATTALLAMRMRPVGFAATVVASSVMTIISTLYLGIHWLTDVAAGLLVAYVAARLAVRWAQGATDEQSHSLDRDVVDPRPIRMGRRRRVVRLAARQ